MSINFVTAGTVTATLGSKTVVGAATFWTDNNCKNGDTIWIAGVEYWVDSLVEATQTITLAQDYLGATGSGKAYAIKPTSPEWVSNITLSQHFVDLMAILESQNSSMLSKWVAASDTAPASLDFNEDTDNGTHRARVKAPSSLAANIDVTLAPFLASFSGLAPAASKLPYFTAADTMAMVDFGSAGRSLVAATSTAELRTSLNVNVDRVLLSAGANVLDVDNVAPKVHYAVSGAATVDVSVIDDYEEYIFIAYNSSPITLDCGGGGGRFTGPGIASTLSPTTVIVPANSIARLRYIAGNRYFVEVIGSNKYQTIFCGDVAGLSAFSAIDLGAYRKLRLSGFLSPVTDGQAVLLRFDTNNGASYDSGASDYVFNYIRGTGSTAAAAESTNTYIALALGSSVGNDTGEGISFKAEIDQFNKSTYAFVVGSSIMVSGSGAQVAGTFGGRRMNATARNALQVSFASGNISAGHILLEGIEG